MCPNGWFVLMADRKGRREKPGKHPCLHLHSGALVFHPPHLFTATPHPELGCGLGTQVQFTSCFPAHLTSDWEQTRLYRKLHRWTHVCMNMARAHSCFAASQTSRQTLVVPSLLSWAASGKPLNLSGPLCFQLEMIQHGAMQDMPPLLGPPPSSLPLPLGNLGGL